MLRNRTQQISKGWSNLLNHWREQDSFRFNSNNSNETNKHNTTCETGQRHSTRTSFFVFQQPFVHLFYDQNTMSSFQYFLLPNYVTQRKKTIQTTFFLFLFLSKKRRWIDVKSQVERIGLKKRMLNGKDKTQNLWDILIIRRLIVISRCWVVITNLCLSFFRNEFDDLFATREKRKRVSFTSSSSSKDNAHKMNLLAWGKLTRLFKENESFLLRRIELITSISFFFFCFM